MSDTASQKTISIGDAPWLRNDATQTVFRALTARGHMARAVGGCVRNTLFASLASKAGDETHPPAVTDIDIASTASPEENIELAETAGLKTVPTGLEHGTITIIADHQGFEVTTLRRDVATDGRHAEVAFTDDWALDAARRDLTMNAIYADADGTIFDPLGGYDDLKCRMVRFVGDAHTRIREDYLRILRFFRFFAQYGYGQPDVEGLRACIAERRGLSRLSSERIHQELMKLIVAPGACETLEIMIQHGILTEVLPVAPNIKRLSRLAAIDRNDIDPALRLAALTVHVGDDAPRLTKHLRLSNRETKTLTLVADQLAAWADNAPNSLLARQWLYLYGSNDYLRRIKFNWALTEAPANDAVWMRLAHLPLDWHAPKFPIGGNDLIELGATKGPELGVLLKQLEQSWMAGGFQANRCGMLTMAREQITKQSNK